MYKTTDQEDDVTSAGRQSGRQGDKLRIWCESARRVEVVVVGGGVAGLAAVKKLLDYSVTDLVLLEAQARLGGRVSTYREGDVLVEDGAEWIHGDSRNLLHRLASSLNVLDPLLPDHAWDWRVVTESGEQFDEDLSDLAESLMEETEVNGVLRPYYCSSYGQFFINRLEEIGVEGERGTSLAHYLQQIVNYEEGTNSWLDIAARDADQYVDQGEDYHWTTGFDTLLTHLKAGIPESVVRLSSPVCGIYWDNLDNEDSVRGGSGVLVTTASGDAFLARHVIFTASVAFLQRHHSSVFIPPLPPTVVNTLSGVKLGVANKLFVGWPEPWWGVKPVHFDIFWTNVDLPPHMWWLRGVVTVTSAYKQRAVLQMFITGKCSVHMESLTEDQVKEHLLFLLRKISRQHVPEPTFFRRTKWASNPWTLGSYSSFVTVEGNKAGLHRRNQLATPLYNSRDELVVSWAGEHTHNTRYGTVDGAMEAGRREAMRLVQLLRPQKVTTTTT